MKQKENVKSKVISGLMWKFGERISAQMVSLIVSVILARLLDPSDYGVIALVMVFITIANVFVSSGFGNALIQKKDADNLDFSSVFYINIGVGIIIYLLLYLFAPYIARFYKMPVLSSTLRVLGIRIIIASVNSVQQAYVSRNMLFKRFFWSTLFGTIASGIVGVIMAYRGFGVWALVFQYLTNTCTDTLILWFTVKWRPEIKCSWSRAKKLIIFGSKLLISGLLDTGYKQIRNFIIGKKYTSSDLAYYNQGDKYPSLLVVNINASISSVLFPALAKYQDNTERVKQMTRRAIQVSSYVLWPFMFGFGVVAEPMVRLLLTEKWLPCVPFIRIFCFTYGLWPIHTANLQAINALGRSDLFLKLEIVKKIIGIITVLLTMNHGPLVMAYSLIVTDIICTFINSFPNYKLLKYYYWEQIGDMMPGFLLSAFMAIVVFPLSYLHFSDLAIVIIQVIVGVLVYIVVSIVIKPKAYCYLIGFIRKK